ncbi:SusC/RagA family TonB-linked outer membrane protein [Sphingobacterium corticis]|uniref:SusC/RagA family TonB-linked outer membrane protein n=1 Tax=Sphingobacterium corticis TaxID=1812823 RepID=A0ABW5NHA9_9SPHI
MKKFLLFTWLFLLIGQFAYAQVDVFGQIMDAKGVLLPGVSVSEKSDPNNAVSTDASGVFRIRLSNEQSILAIYSLGFERQEIVVGAARKLTITLYAGEAHLDEVIVTGYTTQKRSEITASITTISSEELLNAPASHSAANLLQGKAAGVDVMTQTGRPGSIPTVRIRGRSSISSQTEALWVVDGVIASSIPDINPNDIESMSILKDGAATSQYGSRGVNGVVVVTTKRAKQLDTGQLTANLSMGSSHFNPDNFRVMTGEELKTMFTQFTNQEAIPPTPESVLNGDFDWFKNGTQAGRLNNFNTSYIGKSERASIFTSASYYKEEGSVKGFKYDRFSGRLNVDYALTDRLLFKPKINMTYTESDQREHSIYQMYLNLPWDSPYADDGSVLNPRRGNVTWLGRDYSNYLFDLQYNYSTSNTFNIQSNIDFEYKFNDQFTFASSNNLSYLNGEGLTYIDPKSDAGLAENGLLGNNAHRQTSRFSNQMLRYKNNFDKHAIQAFVAYEYTDYNSKSLSALGKGIVPGSQILDITSAPQSIGGTRNEYAFQSGMLQAEYSYDDRYSFQGSIRRDGSSRFGTNKRYGTFFAISGAWNIQNEAFFDVNAINFLRLRSSYGQVGNVPNSFYASHSLFSLHAQYASAPGGGMSQLGNSAVSWETSKNTNIGLEIGFLKRFDSTIELYNNNTDGLLQFVSLPSTAGWSGYWENVGAVRNRGLEASLGASLLPSTYAFQWRLDFNIAFNRNKISALYKDQDIPAGNMRRSVGRDIDSYFMRKWVGVNPENGDPLWEKVDPATGEIEVTNNYNQATLQFVNKTATPKYQGGLSSAMSYKNFYLNAMFAFTKGAWAYNSGRQLFDADGAYPYYNQMALINGWSRWTPENTDATHPRLIYNSQNASNGVSSRYLEDASLLRLRTLSLGYRLPQSLAKKLSLSGLDLYISGDNLWSVTKFSGLDPEGVLAVSASRNPDGDGDATAQYPTPKRILFGVNISF